MFGKLFEGLLHAATPAMWPRILRRLFVILSPITIPLLFVFWCGLIWCAIMLFFVMCACAIIAETVMALGALWRR